MEYKYLIIKLSTVFNIFACYNKFLNAITFMLYISTYTFSINFA